MSDKHLAEMAAQLRIVAAEMRKLKEQLEDLQTLLRVRKLEEALRGTVAVLTADTVGTYQMDDPYWYESLDKAVEQALIALNTKEES